MARAANWRMVSLLGLPQVTDDCLAHDQTLCRQIIKEQVVLYIR